MSASANKQAEEYARLIMEELDPNGTRYIEIYNLEALLLQVPSQSVRGGTTNSRNLSQLLSQNLRPTLKPNSIRQWYQQAKYFVEDNSKRVWVMDPSPRSSFSIVNERYSTSWDIVSVSQRAVPRSSNSTWPSSSSLSVVTPLLGSAPRPRTDPSSPSTTT